MAGCHLLRHTKDEIAAPNPLLNVKKQTYVPEWDLETIKYLAYQVYYFMNFKFHFFLT